MRRCLLLVFFLVAVGIYGHLFGRVWEGRQQVRLTIPPGYVIPSKFSRILALGNHGLLADFLFLKTTTFIGGRSSSGGSLSEDDWRFVIRSLDVVTDLDRHFVDPYLLAEGLLAWDAGMPEEANRLLYKGMETRSKDWRLPFFIGFNHFYFLKDFETAADYIMQAAVLPGSPKYLQTLGARLAYYGGKSKTALLFLQEMLADTDDALLKSRLEKRLLALQGAVAIEEALAEFERQQGFAPQHLDKLVPAGYLKALPPEPYGGEWIVLKNGRVFSTSKFANAPLQQKNQKAPVDD